MDSMGINKQILNSSFPLIIKGVLDWPQLNWSKNDWKTKLHDTSKKYPFRKGVYKCCKTPLWERKCQVDNLTFEEFFSIIGEDEEENPKYWYYFDYKHLEQWFNHNITLKDISWSCLGLENAPSSTIWIGSKGAHTPCHLDSYGQNLIAQLYGKKMWVLFSPEMTDKMRPCRVPYEESSIYSDINFNCSCSDTSGLSEAYFAVLEPGDILYVPKNWWHYVENLTTAVSVNTWLPKKCDNISRLEESMAKCLVISFIRDMSQSHRDDILNPNEDDLPSVLNLEELNFCLRQCQETEANNSAVSFTAKQLSPANIYKLKILNSQELSKVLMKKCQNNFKDSKKDRTVKLEDIINAFCHPEVISLASKKLQMSLNKS